MIAHSISNVRNKKKVFTRLIHRLIVDEYKFPNPKVLNPLHQFTTEKTYPSLLGLVQQNRRWCTSIKNNSPETLTNPSKKWYIRLLGLPFSTREPEIIEFFKGISINREDIVFKYNDKGKFTGEAYVTLYNEEDLNKALSFNRCDLGNRYIEILKTNYTNYNKAKLSQFPEKRETNKNANTNFTHLLKEEYGILRLRGLSYSCTEESIREFFKGYNIVKDGINIVTVGGRPSREAFVIFETKDQADRARSLDKEKIGDRYIELFVSNIREFGNFLHSKENMPNIPLDKKKSTLLMAGLPFNVKKSDIIKFFESLDLKEDDVHLLPGHRGKFSGNCLVTFKDELEAQKALKTKDRSHIGNRYVELYEYK